MIENIVLHPDKRFKQVVFWGHPLHSHTHSYIYAGFKKAFDFIGYKTHWFTDDDNIDMDFSNSLFFATSDAEKKIPLDKTSCYVLHNVDARRYFDAGCKKILFIQTRPQQDHFLNDNSCEIFNKHTVLKKNPDVNCLYMAWATDLLPTEIHESCIENIFEKKTFVWVGTWGDSKGEYQNGTELLPYAEECKKNGIETIMINPWSKHISFEENRKIVQQAYLAPAIQGPWQIDNAYLPCRIFKNISYGNIGITNNACVNDIFSGLLIYDRDPIKLFEKSIDERNDFDFERHKYLMHIVAKDHTYLNRIDYILRCLPD